MVKAGYAEEEASDANQEDPVANVGTTGMSKGNGRSGGKGYHHTPWSPKGRRQGRIFPGRSQEAAPGRRSRNAPRPAAKQATGPGTLNARESPGRQWQRTLETPASAMSSCVRTMTNENSHP
eukprot:8041414-Pyramimonas_sp.AAC.1